VDKSNLSGTVLYITKTNKIWKIFKATKQRNFKGKIFGFDIETADDNKSFVMASLYDIQKEKAYLFYKKENLIRALKKKRFKNSIIVASNLNFDFFGLMFSQKEMLQFTTQFRGSDLVYAFSYIYKKNYTKRKGQSGNFGKITFIDTYNYCRMSVEQYGKLLGIPKLDKPDFLGQFPKTYEEFKILKEYNIRDSEISAKYLRFLYDAFELLGATPKMTIASTSMSLFRNKYLKDAFFQLKKKDLKNIFKAYYGGRVEAFKRGKIETQKLITESGEEIINKWNYYDFNSLYPSVMLNDFPNPNTMHHQHKNTVRYINNYEGVSHVEIFCPEMRYPLLPVKTTDKLLFPTGNFQGWYSHVELREAVRLGYTIKEVKETYYFTETCSPFKEFVNDLYKIRRKYQSDKDENGVSNPMESVVKLLLNANYGKYGQKFENRDNWTPFNHTEEELNALPDFERVGDFLRIKEKDGTPAVFCIPIWALYVTAYGRLKLHKAISEHNAIYCDTDSLITLDKIQESTKLGELKLEMTINNGIIVKPKFYAFQGTDMQSGEPVEYVKMKGVGVRMSFPQFCSFMVNPEVAYMKFTKFKEAIRRKLIPNEIQNITKHLSLEDNKRIWETDFNPLKLQESTPINMETFKYDKDIKLYKECLKC